VAKELAATPVRVEDLRMSRKYDIGALVRLVRLLRQERVDVVYTFLIHSHVIGRIAARLANVSVILSSQQIAGWETWPQRVMNRITSRWCSAIVAVSKSVERYLKAEVGISPEKLVTIYNSVDLERFPPRDALFSNPSQPVLGTVARLNPEKDHDTLLEAFQRVRRDHPTARLVIAGDGPERSRLERKAAGLGLETSVEFLGYVDDVREVFRRLDIYIQSSHVEGLSVSVLEALASGLPVVAARVGGNDEAVIENVCGLLVEPGNADALATAVSSLLANRERCCGMGLAARKHVATLFSTEVAMANTQALIDRLYVPRSA
jgi:glycosyltransferase involved in cell wall biosynthesis